MKSLSLKSFTQKAIIRQIDHISRNITGACKANVGALHRIRVASRRLCSNLNAFSSFFKDGKIKKWNKQLKKIIRISGKGRDLDLEISFLSGLKHKIKDKDTKTCINRLLNLLNGKRTLLQSRITKTFNTIEDKQILQQIRRFIIKLPVKPPKKGSICLQKIAELKIAKRLSKMLKYEKYVRMPEKTGKLHSLRIAAKKLRYTLECFQPIYGEKIKKHIEYAHSIQDELGVFHDYDVWMTSSHFNLRRAEKDKQAGCAINLLKKECTVLKKQAYKDFIKLWQSLKRNGEWQSLVRLVTTENRFEK